MRCCLRIAVVASLIPTLFACASSPKVAGEDQTPEASPEPFVRAESEATMRVNEPETAFAYVYGQGDNAAVARLVLEPNAAVPEHRDATEEYIFVLEGHGEITIEGERHEVGPGALIFMPADALVSFQNGDERLVGVQIFAGPEPIEKYEAWNLADQPRHSHLSASAAASASPQDGTVEGFLARFERTVNAHDWETLMSEMVDPGYVSQQHDDFLDGRTDQFISELFYPGLLEIDNEACQGYVRNETHAEKLSHIEDFAVDAVDGQEIHYSFSTLEPECTFEGTLWLRVGDGDGQPDYGVVGASG